MSAQLQTEDLLAKAVLALVSVCDGAHALDGAGFNGVDAPFVHDVCQIPPRFWSFKIRRVLYGMIGKYSKQLSRYGIEYASIAKPTPDDGFCYDKEKARLAKQSAPGLSTPAPPEKLIRLAGDRFEIVFPYNEQIKEAGKHHLGARWDGKAKIWWVPAILANAAKLQEFAQQWQFTIDPDCTDYVQQLIKEAAELHQASSSEDAELILEGFGRSDYQPRPFQRAGILYAIRAQRCFIADDMGLGKTIQALATIYATSSYPALIVTKASLKGEIGKGGWLDECMKAFGGSKNIWRVEKSTDGTYEHTCGLKGAAGQLDLFGEIRCNQCRFETADVYIINYDILSDGWDANTKKNVKLSPVMKAITKRKLLALVLDESQMAKNDDAQRTRACRQVAHEQNIPIRLNLTGTPLENRTKEFIAQLDIIGRLQEFGGSWKFKQRYCNAQQKYVPGRGMVWDFNGSSNLDELNQRLRSSCYVRRLKKDVLKELPDKVRTIIPVDLTNRAEYQKAEKDLVKFIHDRALKNQQMREQLMAQFNGDEDAVAIAMREHANSKAEKAERAEALVKLQTLRQVAARGKFKAIEDWVQTFEETGKKLVIFAFYKETQQALLNAFPHFAHVFGDDSIDARNESVRRFQNDDDCPGIICSIMAAAEGITLTAGADVIFCERPWNPAKQNQAEDRCHRIGQKNCVNAWYFDGISTIDEDMCALIEDKRATTEAAMNGKGGTTDESFMKEITNRIVERNR